jgi:tetratricopeptide (TPR) repeat protein
VDPPGSTANCSRSWRPTPTDGATTTPEAYSRAEHDADEEDLVILDEVADKHMNRDEMHDRVRDAVSWTREECYEKAIEVFEEYLPILSSEGDLQDKRVAAGCFSYYGVCLAMVRHKYAEALKYCNISIRANFMEADHRINLALIYLERDDRRKAVENLEAGLRLQPSNKRIERIFDQIGRRQRVMFGFLNRRNPINVAFGKMRVPKTE